MIASNSVDFLQKKIDEIAKRRRIVLLQNTLRKIKIEKTIEFSALSMFDEIMTLFIKSEFNAKFHREKLYRMMNFKRYFDENQQNLKKFLRECATTFQMKSLIYKKNLIRMIYAQNFLFDRSTEKWYIRSNFQNYFWEIFLKFLQNDIQSTHLRIIDVVDFIKKLKQKADQSMNELIMIFISFEKNFSKIFTKI